MIRCGVDIIEISRIKEAVEKNDKFLGKVFSESEIEYFRSNGCRFEIPAGFFAAKEAFVKFEKSGIRGLELSEISVEHEKSGAPFVVFRGERQGVSLSISHNRTHAIAVVCGDDESRLTKGDDYIRGLVPRRAQDAHKGNCGRVFIVAGSEGMTGAAVLAAKGALRGGAGLVTVGVVKSERHIVACGVFEAMTVALAEEAGKVSADAVDEILKNAQKSDVVVFGPGLGRNEHIHGILKALLKSYCGKLVIDADGLFALGENCDILYEKKCDVVITPHPGEMARLTEKTVDEIQKNRVDVAVEFATRYGISVLLKGHETVIAGNDENGEFKVRINPTGNAGMASGGMGDVLSGVIGALCGQGAGVFEAAVLGAYVHGKAGDMARGKYGVYGLLAGDVADLIGIAMEDEILWQTGDESK